MKFINEKYEEIESEAEEDTKKFYDETFVMEESESSENKLSFDVLMHFINHTMKPQANYQFVMLKELLIYIKLFAAYLHQ